MNAPRDPLFDLPDDNDRFLGSSDPEPEDTSPVIYTEVCRKCGGTGRYNAPSSLGHQVCLQCKGKGKMEYRRSALERQKAQERRVNRKARAAQAQASAKQQEAAAWLEAHPNEAHWLREASARGFDFATRLLQGLKDFGHLTDNQLGAVHRCMLQDEERSAKRAASEKNATVVDISRIEKVFAIASGTGLRRPKLRLASYIFSPAAAHSMNAGAIYVKRCANGDQEQEYLGKIKGGKLFPSRDCTEQDKAKITEVAADPKGAAESYGRLTGNCAICNTPMLRKDSVERGIGPVCAARFGFL